MVTRRGFLAGTGALAGGAALAGRRAAHAQPAPAAPATQGGARGQGAPALPPGRPGRDYTPVVTPDNVALPFRVVRGAKVFHLVAEPVTGHEIAPGLRIDAWGYNGRVHGPTLEAVEGDRVRIYVTNRLPEPTTVHWHGVIVPSGMDGVGGLSQPVIAPGQTFKYEFVLRYPGTFMYHPHFDEMVQMALGMVGLFVVHPRRPQGPRPDRDFALLLHEWEVVPGTARPNPLAMTDFNVLTINARAFPGTSPLVARRGDRVRIRLGNLSAMDHHPIHLHGYAFKVTATDGGAIPASAQWPETTVLVPVGATRDIEFIADNPGDWAMHCHMTHHMMNQMGHEFPNMVGVPARQLDQRVQRLLPGYMTMGHAGMSDMARMNMPVPANSIPMLGGAGPFGLIDMGGMFTILKVRDRLRSYDDDPGWYDNPPETVAREATADELRADGVEPPSRG